VAEVAPNSLVNVKRAHLKILLKKGNSNMELVSMKKQCLNYAWNIGSISNLRI
jgi:hypothetical protein